MNKYDTNYSTNMVAPNEDYPLGSAKNATAGTGSRDGSPFLAKFFNDCIGFFQGMMAKAHPGFADNPDDYITGVSEKVGGSDVADAIEKIIKEKFNSFDHNVPRWIEDSDGWHLGKDITEYVNDGTIWKRLNGRDGYLLMEDIYVGDYFQMSRAISKNSVGTDWVTIAGINSKMGDGSWNGDVIDYNHLVMVPGKGEEGVQAFGKWGYSGRNNLNYKESAINTFIIGSVVTAGSTESDATINQQLYAEFGAHLKTIPCKVTIDKSPSLYNRWGAAHGGSNSDVISSFQAIELGELEVYGSIVWSSTGRDTGHGNKQLPLFFYSKKAMNNNSLGWINEWRGYWLRDVSACGNSLYYACVAGCLGNATHANVDTDNLIRPLFVLGA